MLQLYKNIKARRLQLGMSQEDLAQKVGYSDRTSIAKIEAGKVDLSQSKIFAFAEALNISAPELVGYELDNSSLPSNIIPMPRMNQIPLIGTIACGEPILAEENIEEHVDIPEHIHADFALRCKGDSMTGARIHDGDIVYIRQQPSVDNGQIAAVLIDDEATLKRVYVSPDSIVLQPENAAYPPLVYTGSQMEEVRVLGKLVGFTSTDIK